MIYIHNGTYMQLLCLWLIREPSLCFQIVPSSFWEEKIQSLYMLNIFLLISNVELFWRDTR